MRPLPDSLLAFQRLFPDDDACAAWLIDMRWPDGFVCPACSHDKGWALRGKAHTFECARCRRQTSVTAGTIMHASKLALTAWFAAWQSDLLLDGVCQVASCHRGHGGTSLGSAHQPIRAGDAIKPCACRKRRRSQIGSSSDGCGRSPALVTPTPPVQPASIPTRGSAASRRRTAGRSGIRAVG